MEINSGSGKDSVQRNYNLDLLKAISICLVLIWHLQPFDISIPNLTKFSANMIFKESLIAFYFQVTLIAVPIFFITSQYLYFQKLAEHGYSYFFRRMGVLFYITVFWISFHFVFYYFIAPLASIDLPSASLPATLSAWLHLLMNGGPGGSPFYFLTILMALTVYSTLFAMIFRYEWLGIFLGSFIVIVSLVYFQIQAFKGGVITFSRIENFIIYVPIAYFINAYGSKIQLAGKSILWIAYFLLCFQDILLRHAGLQFNIYGRASIAVGAAALACSLINRKNTGETKLANLLSVYSLGIFSLHLYIHYFVITYMLPVLVMYGVPKKIPLWEFRINIQLLIMGFLTILLTLLCVALARKSPLKVFVT
jgi:surface polysaccharide O-acyltransferase-like enzyme